MKAELVESKIRTIIVVHLGVGEAEVTPTAHFVDDLGADSLDIVELVMTVEEEFEIEIPDKDVEKMALVRDVFAYVKKRVGVEG